MSLTIGGKQIKIIMSYHYTPNRIAKIKIVTSPHTGMDAEKLENSHIAGKNVKWYSHYGKIWQFLLKLNMQLPYKPAITHLGIYQEN